MFKDLFRFYRVQVILSLSLFVVLLSQVWSGNGFEIIYILLGALIGTFILDLDYLFYAYFINYDDSFSHQVKEYIKSKNFMGLMVYTIYHGNDVKNKTLNSALFQIALCIFCAYLIGSNVNIFFKTLVLSILLNSIYRFIYFYLQHEHTDWFWMLKKTPGLFFIITYNFGILVVVGLSILFIR